MINKERMGDGESTMVQKSALFLAWLLKDKFSSDGKTDENLRVDFIRDSQPTWHFRTLLACFADTWKPHGF